MGSLPLAICDPGIVLTGGSLTASIVIVLVARLLSVSLSATLTLITRFAGSGLSEKLL